MREPIWSGEAEQSVLGAILVKPEALDEVSELIQADDFCHTAHGLIFKAMQELHKRQEPVDLVTVTMKLKEWGKLEEVGGPTFLAGLSEQVGFATNANFYARIVKEKSMLRKLAARSQEILAACYSSDLEVPDLLQWVESQVYEVTSASGYFRGLDLSPALLEAHELIKLDIPEKRTYLDPWLRESEINMVCSPRGYGKTMVGMAILEANTRGKNFGPWKIGEPVNCLFLDGEMALQDIRGRLRDYFPPIPERPGKLFYYSDHYATSLGFPRASLLDTTWCHRMHDLLLKNNVKVWVVDNISALAPGIDENSKEEWDPINQFFIELRFSGITTIFLHHSNKAGGQRGTGAREDALDFSIMLDRPKDYCIMDGTRFTLKFTKARVSQEDAHLVGDTEFALEKNPGGQYVWTWGPSKGKNKVRILEMLDQGATHDEIAKELGLKGTSRIRQVKSEAVKKSWLTEEGKLTQAGFDWMANKKPNTGPSEDL